MLQGKQIVIGVCGGIAAYKVCDLVRILKKMGADCYCMMTESAQEFITPLTLSTLTGQKVVCGMFDQRQDTEVEHISWAKRADVLVLAPANLRQSGPPPQGFHPPRLPRRAPCRAGEAAGNPVPGPRTRRPG